VSDGYVVIRRSTLSYLIECARLGGGLENVPEEVARDLGVAVVEVEAPTDEERIAAAGPLLSFREHVELLLGDPDLELPRSGQSSQFWQLVTQIVISILRNEAEAVRRIVAERGMR
jgi:hypothetical protein